MLEILFPFLFVAAIWGLVGSLMWLMEFMVSPEKAMWQLGRCIGAFRRGFAGEPWEGREDEEPGSQPGPAAK